MNSRAPVLFVARSRLRGDSHAGQGALDAEAVAERLGQSDAGFTVVRLDPREDLAGQIDDWYEAQAEPPSEAALYVSSRVLRADGELLLSLDANHPDTADAVADVLLAVRDGSGGSCVAILDLRVEPGNDPLEPMQLVALGRVAARSAKLEVLAAVRAFSADDEAGAVTPSPFTRSLLLALDDVNPQERAEGATLFDVAREASDVLLAGYSLVHVSAEDQPTTVAWLRSQTFPDRPSAPESITQVRDELPSPTPPPVAVAAPAAAPAAASIPPAAASIPPAAASIPPARPSVPPVSLESVLAEAEACAKSGDDEEALTKYRKALALVGTGDGPESDRGRIYLLVAEAKHRQGKAREAIAGFEKALASGAGVLPEAARAEKALLSLYLGEKDYRAAQQAQDRILSRVSEPTELAHTLLSFAGMWLADALDRLRGREMLERVIGVAPDNLEAHRMLLALAEQEERLEDALALRRRIPELLASPRERAEALFALGHDLLREHKRDDMALDVLEAALEADPGLLEPLAELATALAERQEWSELEGVYKRMIERLPRLADEALRTELDAELSRRLGLLLREHLADSEGALQSFERAAESAPRSVVTHRDIIELAQELGDQPCVTRHALALTVCEPINPKGYHLLFESFMRGDEIERAHEAAQVLIYLGAANDRERALAEAHAEDARTRPTGVLSPDDWALLRASLLPAEQMPDIERLARIFRAAGPTIVAALADLAERAGRATPLDASLRVDPETTTVSAARTLIWASRALGLELPEIYLEEASSEAMTPVLRSQPVSVVGSGALRGWSLGELSFLAGYHLAMQAPEHRLVRLSPQMDDLAACFVTAVVLAVPDTPIPEHLAPLVGLLLPAIRERLSADGESELDEAVIEFDTAGARADLNAYARAVEVAAVRAGFLLAGSLPNALKALSRKQPGLLTDSERRAELLSFAVSDQAAALRERLGLLG